MTDMSFEHFLELHDAVRLRNRLGSALSQKSDLDEEIVEGYMAEEDRCNSAIIEGYMMKDLDDSEKNTQSHLEKCESCRKTAEGIKELRDALEEQLEKCDLEKNNHRE